MTCLIKLFLILVTVNGFSAAEKTYIISTDKEAKPSAFPEHGIWYSSMLAKVRNEAFPLHIYSEAFHGFSAILNEEEAATMEALEGVLAVIPDTRRTLHTTRTPDFLGLDKRSGIWPRSDYGSDIIIGVLDTGIWPESRSFSDGNLRPVPKKWKGQCETGHDFPAHSCNRKIIGARYFVKGYEAMNGPLNETMESRSPRDTDGHGTHTASTAAGRHVAKANMLGYAYGLARGVAPKARIAAYKVCWASGCFDSDILAAFDAAVSDGVDIISLSVGGGVVPYYMDSISIGAYGAMSRGIFVSASAGNQGPGSQTVTNLSPWITTVGASTLDRSFPAEILLGDGQKLAGASLYSGRPTPTNATLPLVDSATLAAKGVDAYSATLCLEGSLDPSLVKGKIVLCGRGSNARVAKGEVVLKAGGRAMILANSALDGEGLVSDAHVLPAAAVGYTTGNLIRKYIAKSADPTATIVFCGTVLNVRPAPVTASFSSRGPNQQAPGILKPDIVAPGVNILAAWTGAVGPSSLPSDTRHVEYNIISGTSMACPHVSGLAALLRSSHSKWSPAAIRSALMTTAYTVDNSGRRMADEATGNQSTPFDHGAGHVDPQKAMDPGLIYDIDLSEYVQFLCGLNYSERSIHVLTRSRPDCSAKLGDINYPSFSAVFDQADPHAAEFVAKFKRSLTNVGPARSTYQAYVDAPPGVHVTVEPSFLKFNDAYQKVDFTLTVSARRIDLQDGASKSLFGRLVWKDGTHVVQSPIAITFQQPY